MANLTVEIVTPEAALWQGPATSLKSRTSDGELMVLAQHAPLVGDVLAGVVVVTSTDGVAYIAVDGGYLHVAGDEDGGTRATVLASVAEVASSEAAALEALSRLTAITAE
ncbi:MAG: F0F1 ATP synthase subunit epsilon [Acidobacteria bacterium]|nr:F0F1 ATP synthase subunit epsilon [Acidobacteriota bacterium]